MKKQGGSMKVKFKRILSFIMTLAILVAVLPQLSVCVYAETATLTNLGYLGTVNIGSKTESGKWFKTYVQGKPVFCLDLGKVCHSGDTFSKFSTETISSESDKKEESLKAKIGYWYYVTENESNKAWIVAQCLIWGIEEGITSKSELVKIIKQIKDSAGYKSNTAEKLYDRVFEDNTKVTCTITKWKSTAQSRQELLEIKSGDKTTVKPKYHKLNHEAWFRQRITIQKQAEDGLPLEGVKFKLTALNYKEMYSYAVEGKDKVSSSADNDGFEMIGETDKTGTLGFRFTYRIQSKDYYYYDSEDLEGLSKSEKQKLKDELDEKGYEYADSLSKEDAYVLVFEDLNKQKENTENEYLLEELSSGNTNVTISPDVIGEAEATHGKITRVSDTSFKVVISNGWWRNEDKTWDDAELGVNYRGAYRPFISNKYKKVKITIEKKDADTKISEAQGDAKLDGAIYVLKGVNGAKIYNDKGETIGSTNKYVVKDGKIETDYLQCGKEYQLKEFAPGEGYFIDEEIHMIKVDGSGYTEVMNIEKKPIDVSYEKVVKGQIEITKLMSDGTTGHVPPEADAKFQVYLASAGSYDDAKATDKDCITTNEKGYAITKKLPYGTYVVHQIDGNKKTEFIKDFVVKIDEHEKIYKYTLNDSVLKTYLRIIKKDSRTGKTVLKSGTTYQIYYVDKKGKEKLIKQRFSNGNSINIVDRFSTDESGVITTHEQLEMGKYRIKEIDSANGFYNAKKYIEIELTKDSYKVECDEKGQSYNIAEVEYLNDEVYGRLTIEKRGEILSNVKNDEKGNKKFIYEDSYLEGVEFEICAKEDIFTQDNQGTKWFSKGEKVAVIITGSGADFTKKCGDICTYSVDEITGAVTVNLPLGKYTVREVKTNYGYVIGERFEWNVEFIWQGQDDIYVLDNTEMTDKLGILKVKNNRAKAEINIVKKDQKIGIGVKNAKFGLYTKDNIYADDGRLLVTAGELLAVITTDENGYAKADIGLPLMSQNYKVNEQGNISLNSGDYYFIEQEISDGYYLDNKQIPVHVEYKDDSTQIISVEVKHVNVPTEVEIDKVTLAGSEEIGGCELEIADTNNNRIISWTTGDKKSVIINDRAEELGYTNFRTKFDENGNIIINGLLHDKEYILTEKRPADGYVTAESINFQIRQKNNEEGNVGTTVYIKNSNGKYVATLDNRVVMKDDTTKIEFAKMASDTNGLLKGAEYKVYDSNGREVYSFTTSNKKSEIIEGILRINETYTFVESKVPKGYKKAEDVKITVGDTGKIQELKVIDQRVVKQEIGKIIMEEYENQQIKESPKTGENRMIFIIPMLLAVVAGLTCFVSIGKIHKEKINR